MNFQDKLSNNMYDVKSNLKLPVKPELSIKFPTIEQIRIHNTRMYFYEKDFEKYQELSKKEYDLKDKKHQEFIKDLFDYHFTIDIQNKYKDILNSLYHYAYNNGTSYIHIASIFYNMIPIFNVIVKWSNRIIIKEQVMKKTKDEIIQHHLCKNCKIPIDNDDNICKICSEIYVPCSWCKEEYRLEKIEKTSTGVYLCSECWGNAPR